MAIIDHFGCDVVLVSGVYVNPNGFLASADHSLLPLELIYGRRSSYCWASNGRRMGAGWALSGH